MGAEEVCMSLDPQAVEKRLHELRNLGKAAAEAKRKMVVAEEGKKGMLAVLMKEYATKGFDSAAAQEREARADPRMQQFIEAWGISVELYESARWELEVAKIGVSAYQTLEATRRVEMRGYGL
jgi:hypothetical protein